jgi:predicted metal-dependent hydrolase
MSKIDIYDEEKIARLLYVQKAQGIDFNHDINWNQSIDMSKGFLPLDDNAILFPEADSSQRLVISQLLGLIVASTISELEDVAYKLKGATWENVLRKYPVNPELFELGEHFFEDEKKHSLAFKHYINLFAEKVDVDPKDLKDLLPSSDNSFLSKIYHLDSMAGGMAIWWLIAAVEEESLLIFNHMRKSKESIDPLYYELHKCHYEEEVRHKSYASIMLEINTQFARVPHAFILRKLDFILAEVLNLTWTFNQLFKLRSLKRLKNHHPFFQTLSGLSTHLENRNSLEVMYKLFNSAPYIKDMLHLSEHMHIKLLLERFGVQKIPFKTTLQGNW